MSEKAECTAFAAVLIYDDQQKKWKSAGSGQGGSMARVSVYRHLEKNTFRVVGRKEDTHEVVINCGIQKQLKYNEATETFHQWRDSRTVYGLNFKSKDDAVKFSTGMYKAIESLSQGGAAPPPPQGPSRAELEAQRLEKERIEREKAERARMEQERRERELQQQQQRSAVPPPPAPPSGGAVPPPPPAPPSGGPPPPPPGPPKVGGGVPPPPPGPPPAQSSAPAAPPAPSGGGLAAALAGAKLKKVEPSAEPAKPPPSSGGGGGDFMGELQKRMMQKRQAAESNGPTTTKVSPIMNSAPKQPSENKRPSWQQKNSNVGSTGSLNKTKPSTATTNGSSSADLDAIKQEIIEEVRNEIQKMKEEILQAIRENR